MSSVKSWLCPVHAIPCHQKISIPGSTATKHFTFKNLEKNSYFALLFHDPYMKRIFIVERRHLQNKNRLPLHEDYSVYRTQRCIYNTSFQLTGWNGAWVIGDIVVLVAGACHLAISAIPRWINTCTMKPATEAEKQQYILGAKTTKKRKIEQ